MMNIKILIKLDYWGKPTNCAPTPNPTPKLTGIVRLGAKRSMIAYVADAISPKATTASKSGLFLFKSNTAILIIAPCKIYLTTFLHSSRELKESIIDNNNNKVLFSLININIYKEKKFFLNKENKEN